MLYSEQVLGTLAENLALDEALLLQAEAGGPEVLRVWESPEYAVVLGAGCKLAEDVDEDACRADRIPILRRGSGGGTVLVGPGCLLYSLVLSFDRDPCLGDIRASYRWILARIAAALSSAGNLVESAGTSDLAWGDLKVSGNSQQRKRQHVLHHGTILYRFDLNVVERYLRSPGRQPEYRRQRDHRQFLANLPMTREAIQNCLRQAWPIQGLLPSWPHAIVERLLAEKYANQDWVRIR